MQTDHFSLRLSSLTAHLPITHDEQQSAVTAAQETFETLRRQGLPLDQALEKAEAVLLEPFTPTFEAASRLNDLLEADFAAFPHLTRVPHFPHLLQHFMPLLTEPPSRLADIYLIGLVTEYTAQPATNGL